MAHSIGNPIFIKYISKNNLNIGQYISLAGFSREYYNEGKDMGKKSGLEELPDVIKMIYNQV